MQLSHARGIARASGAELLLLSSSEDAEAESDELNFLFVPLLQHRRALLQSAGDDDTETDNGDDPLTPTDERDFVELDESFFERVTERTRGKMFVSVTVLQGALLYNPHRHQLLFLHELRKSARDHMPACMFRARKRMHHVSADGTVSIHRYVQA